MDTQQHRNTKEKVVDIHEDEKKLKKDSNISGPAIANTSSSSAGAAAAVASASPPSASSSPSHEFSFTISLHSSSSSTQFPDNNNNSNKNKTSKTPPASFAIDLSPADDIFFHGHLLPLHLLSHLPVSPRTSTNSLDSFTLPIRELLDNQKPINNNIINSNNSSSSRSNSSNNIKNNISSNVKTSYNNGDETKARDNKPKSFSLFGWRKGCEVNRDKESREKQKKSLKLEVSHVLKRYVRMVRPLLFFKGKRENLQFHRQPYNSFSGNLSWKNKQELRGRRGEYSAPASMRTSPTNSGLLVATTSIPSSTSDSTMEELQAAIQAAIAHCKNSIAAEEKIKC